MATVSLRIWSGYIDSEVVVELLRLVPDYMQAIDFTVLKQKVFSIVFTYLIDTVTVIKPRNYWETIHVRKLIYKLN